jgi:hypothetical protein
VTDHGSRMDREPAESRPLVAMVYGPLVWSAHFLIVYVGNALWCAKGIGWLGWFGLPPPRGLVIAATAAAAALISWQLLRAWRTFRRTDPIRHAVPQRIAFMSQSALLLSALSLVAVVYTAIPAFLVPACG